MEEIKYLAEESKKNSDILWIIFLMLKYPGDLLSCSQVCKLWRNITKYNDYLLWKRFSRFLIGNRYKLYHNHRGSRHKNKVLENMYKWCKNCANILGTVGCILTDNSCCPSCWLKQANMKKIEASTSKDMKYCCGIIYVSIRSIMGIMFLRHLDVTQPDNTCRERGFLVIGQQDYDRQKNDLIKRWKQGKQCCDCCICVTGCKRRLNRNIK